MNQLTTLLLLGSLLLLVSAKGSHLISQLESTTISMLAFVHTHMITKSPHLSFRNVLQASPFLLHAQNHCLRSKSVPISSFHFIFLSINAIHFQHKKKDGQRISKMTLRILWNLHIQNEVDEYYTCLSNEATVLLVTFLPWCFPRSFYISLHPFYLLHDLPFYNQCIFQLSNPLNIKYVSVRIQIAKQSYSKYFKQRKFNARIWLQK